MPADAVLTGIVLHPHGLDGDLVVRLFLNGPAVPLPEGMEVFAGGRRLEVVRCRVRDHAGVLAGFGGITTREEASTLAGLELTVERSAALSCEGFRPLGLFTGMKLVCSRLEGMIEELDADTPNPLVTVRSAGRLFEVPVNLLNAGRIDWPGKIVEAEIPAGLEDLGEPV